MPRRFLIDTDTASDDAVALVMALRHPDIEVVAITVVSGNVAVGQGVINALYTAELCQAEVPIYRGAAEPLVRPRVHADFFHGADGLGDQGYPAPSGSPKPEHGVEALIGAVKANPSVTLVTLGPLTNVARAVERAPEIVAGIQRCVVMGGAACAVGNVTPAAEYNIWCDPEAARIVFHSGLPIEMVGWELCRKTANLSGAEMRKLRELDTPWAHFALDCNRTAIEANHKQSGDPGLALPDPVAMAIAIEPALCLRSSRHFVDVEVGSELTRGMTVIDALDVAADERNRAGWGEVVDRGRKVEVCWELDIPGWKRLLFELLG